MFPPLWLITALLSYLCHRMSVPARRCMGVNVVELLLLGCYEMSESWRFVLKVCMYFTLRQGKANGVMYGLVRTSTQYIKNILLFQAWCVVARKLLDYAFVRGTSLGLMIEVNVTDITCVNRHYNESRCTASEITRPCTSFASSGNSSESNQSILIEFRQWISSHCVPCLR